MTAAARADLLWWVSFLSSHPLLCASFPTRPWPRPPFVLYTDAEGSGGVGAVLLAPGSPLRWFGGSVSAGLRRRVASRWGYGKCPIFLLEAAVPLACLRVFGEGLRSQRLLIFVDNTTALFALRKGRSKLSPPLNELCFAFWGLARRLELDVTLVWVPTRFNVADDPSRGEPPLGVATPSVPVADLVWERVFAPALRLRPR